MTLAISYLTISLAILVAYLVVFMQQRKHEGVKWFIGVLACLTGFMFAQMLIVSINFYHFIPLSVVSLSVLIPEYGYLGLFAFLMFVTVPLEEFLLFTSWKTAETYSPVPSTLIKTQKTGRLAILKHGLILQGLTIAFSVVIIVIFAGIFAYMHTLSEYFIAYLVGRVVQAFVLDTSENIFIPFTSHVVWNSIILYLIIFGGFSIV